MSHKSLDNVQDKPREEVTFTAEIVVNVFVPLGIFGSKIEFEVFPKVTD